MFGFMVHLFTVLFVALKRSRDQPSFSYDQALYFVIYTLCTVGFGDPPVISGSIEQLYACLVLCGAVLCNGYIIATFVAILQRADIHQDRRGKLRETLAVLEHFSMPAALQDEVLQFQDHLLGHSLSSAYASVVEGLPQEMRNNIDVAVKLRMVDTAPFLASLHDLLRIAIAKELVNAVAKPEQNLFVQGEQCANMVFISHGLVDLIHRGGVQHTKLRTGQYFGVSALLTAFRNPSSNGGSKPGSPNTAHAPSVFDNAISNDNNPATGADVNAATTSSQQPPRHTVSAKAVSYCDLWLLRGTTVVAMGQRFIKIRSLISRLHDEFKVNAAAFSCYFPDEGDAAVSGVTEAATPLMLQSATAAFSSDNESSNRQPHAAAATDAADAAAVAATTDAFTASGFATGAEAAAAAFCDKNEDNTDQTHRPAEDAPASPAAVAGVTSGGGGERESHSSTSQVREGGEEQQMYVQTADSLSTSVRVHSLTERLHICHARVRVLVSAVQQQQQLQQQGT